MLIFGEFFKTESDQNIHQNEFHKVAAAMANVLVPYCQCFPRDTTSRF